MSVKVQSGKQSHSAYYRLTMFDRTGRRVGEAGEARVHGRRSRMEDSLTPDARLGREKLWAMVSGGQSCYTSHHHQAMAEPSRCLLQPHTIHDVPQQRGCPTTPGHPMPNASLTELDWLSEFNQALFPQSKYQKCTFFNLSSPLIQTTLTEGNLGLTLSNPHSVTAKLGWANQMCLLPALSHDQGCK